MERFRFAIRPVAVFAGIIGAVSDFLAVNCAFGVLEIDSI